MRGVWGQALGVMALVSLACGDSQEREPQTVTAIGLFELELPDGWSVIVPTATEEELVPVLSVGTDGQPVEERVGVILFDATVWETLDAAANEWRERSSVALDFEDFEEDGIAHLRDEFTVTNGSGEATAVSIVEILSMPGEPEQSWVVVVCGSGPDRMEEAREACSTVLKTLKPWELPEMDR